MLAIGALTLVASVSLPLGDGDANPDPDGLRALVVEAHDEWTGDPPMVPPAPAVPNRAPLAVRNRNPLNMKLGAATRAWVEAGLATISRWLPRDGGRFLKFHSSAFGFRAAVQLLTSPAYASLDLDAALKRWSHNGYGAEIVPSIDPATPVSSLAAERLEHVLRAMANAEGYRSSTIDDEITRAVAEAARPVDTPATPRR